MYYITNVIKQEDTKKIREVFENIRNNFPVVKLLNN